MTPLFFLPRAKRPVVCVAAFCAVAYGWHLLNKWCPWGDPVSGSCLMPPWLDMLIMSIAAAIASTLVLVLGVLVAPSHRDLVPWLIFAVGAAIALAMALVFAAPAVTAICTGFGVATLLANRFGRDEHSP